MHLPEADMTRTPQRRRSRPPMAPPSSMGEQNMALPPPPPLLPLLLLLLMAGRARLRLPRGADLRSPRSRGRAIGPALAATPTSLGGTCCGMLCCL